MTKLIAALTLTSALALCQSRNGRHEDWRNWDYKDSQTIEKSFDVSKGGDARKLRVDQMNGYIHITGGSGLQIKVTLHKETHGRSQAAVDEGKRDVNLEMTQQSNYVRLNETAPWRKSNGDDNYRGDDWYGYHVALNVDIEVPAGTELDLHSFNDGVEIKRTSGDYNVHAFNGPINMEDVSGSGEVQSFNGPVNVSYRQNPQKDTLYKTFNGELNVKFQPDFNADLHFQDVPRRYLLRLRRAAFADDGQRKTHRRSLPVPVQRRIGQGGEGRPGAFFRRIQRAHQPAHQVSKKEG